MRRTFWFADLYIRISPGLAALYGVIGLLQAIALRETWGAAIALVGAAFSAFLVLVFADLLACARAIERNTRPSDEHGPRPGRREEPHQT